MSLKWISPKGTFWNFILQFHFISFYFVFDLHSTSFVAISYAKLYVEIKALVVFHLYYDILPLLFCYKREIGVALIKPQIHSWLPSFNDIIFYVQYRNGRGREREKERDEREMENEIKLFSNRHNHCIYWHITYYYTK